MRYEVVNSIVSSRKKLRKERWRACCNYSPNFPSRFGSSQPCQTKHAKLPSFWRILVRKQPHYTYFKIYTNKILQYFQYFTFLRRLTKGGEVIFQIKIEITFLLYHHISMHWWRSKIGLGLTHMPYLPYFLWWPVRNPKVPIFHISI